MIIKKPYAFLIKKFRWIHGILLAMLVFLAIKSVNIYTFFSDYATNHYYVMSSMLASEYIDLTLFIVTALAILVGLLIYFILSYKNKDRKTYVFLCIYYIILFIYFIYMLSIFQNLQEKSLGVETVRAIRDISIIISLPQIIFLFIILGRTLGFNLKQFDFKKDLEEMQIDTKDYEEVEVEFGKNNYKTARFLRKTLRLTKYFILENKFVVTIIASIIVLVASLATFINIKIYNVSYNENVEILANNVYYTVTSSYVTNKDINNNIITKDKKYILIKVKANNKSTENYNLYRETFRLELNNEMLIPTYGLDNKFIDVGKTYTPFEIKSGETKEFIVVFELDEDVNQSEFILRIKNYEYGSFASLESEYKDINVIPQYIDLDDDHGKLYLPISLDFKDTLLGNTNIILNSYEISSTFKEKYEYCITDDNCTNNTYIVKPISNGKGNLSVLKLRGTLDLDDDLYISKYISNLGDLLSYFGKINYRYRGNYKTASITKIPTKLKNTEYSYVEVPSELAEANKIEIILIIRGIKYALVLK